MVYVDISTAEEWDQALPALAKRCCSPEQECVRSCFLGLVDRLKLYDSPIAMKLMMTLMSMLTLTMTMALWWK